jgi:lysozyme family protein
MVKAISDAFHAAYEATMLAEGGYILHNVKADRGGQTYAGIARKHWPKWRGWVDIDSGSTPEASDVRDFYKQNFWEPLNLDSLDPKVAATIYDFGVNAGTGTAAKLAQLVAGATPDGRIGPVTLDKINAMDPDKFVLAFALAKIARYRDIVQRDRTQLKFLLGWVNRTLKGVA